MSNEQSLLRVLTNQVAVFRARMEQVALRQRFLSHGGNRNYNLTLGYPEQVTAELAETYYRRRPTMHNAIGAIAEDSWKLPPVVSEDGDEDTPFTRAFNALVNDDNYDDRNSLKFWQSLMRADKLAGLGEYSILHVGFNDAPTGKPLAANALNKAVNPADGMNILYLSPYSQKDVGIHEWATDSADSHYRQPAMYKVAAGTHMRNGSSSVAMESSLIHRTRVIHIVEEKLSNDVFGVVKAGVIFDDVMNLLKIVGGAGEASWLNIAQKYIATLEPDVSFGETEEEERAALMQLSGKLENLRNDLQAVVLSRGLKDIKPVSGEMHDASGAFNVGVRSISAGVNKPARMIVGNEAGELASSTDLENYAATIQARQTLFCEPEILRPATARLIWAGVLPKPKKPVRFGRLNPETGFYEWPSIFVPTQKQKAETAHKRSLTAVNFTIIRDKGVPITDDEIRGALGLPPMATVARLQTNAALIGRIRTYAEASPYESLLVSEDAERVMDVYLEMVTEQLAAVDIDAIYREIRAQKLNAADADFAEQIRPIVASHLPALDPDADKLLAVLFVIMLRGRLYGESQVNRPLSSAETVRVDANARAYVAGYLAALLGDEVDGVFDANFDPRSVPAADIATATLVAASVTNILRDESVSSRVRDVRNAYNTAIINAAARRSDVLADAATMLIFSVAQYHAVSVTQPTHKQRLQTNSKSPRLDHLAAVGEVAAFDAKFSTGDKFPPEPALFFGCQCGWRPLYLTPEQATQMGV